MHTEQQQEEITRVEVFSTFLWMMISDIVSLNAYHPGWSNFIALQYNYNMSQQEGIMISLVISKAVLHGITYKNCVFFYNLSFRMC